MKLLPIDPRLPLGFAGELAPAAVRYPKIADAVRQRLVSYRHVCHLGGMVARRQYSVRGGRPGTASTPDLTVSVPA
jgi:hypothetical protein